MKPSQYPSDPEHLWEHFYQISRIPRPSGKEQAMRDYILGLAKERGFSTQTDSAGNLVVYVPASAGHEQASVVAVQNHLDMVTVKTGDSEHDFDRDALTLLVEGDWLTADRTTLGADNGLGVSAALSLMTDDSIVRPPLELVFTVEEETGLFGASGFAPNLLSAKRMINLDTEAWGEIYLGCAGGYGFEAKRQLMSKLPRPGLKPKVLSLSKLSGGHSGVQIHEQLGNANKLLIELLKSADDLTWQLSEFTGGVAHNVIAREATAKLFIDENELNQWQDLLADAKSRWQSYLPEPDQQFELLLTGASEPPETVLTEADQQSFLNLVSILPHGAQSYNLNQPADLVDLSCNLAVLRVDEERLTLQTSLRFFNEQQALGLKQTFVSIFEQFHLAHEVILDYPGWNPNFDSELVKQTQQLAESITGQPAELKAIHAGLECGILLSKKPDMDVVSFGPTITGAHSPSEQLQISTVKPFWQLLSNLMSELAVG